MPTKTSGAKKLIERAVKHRQQALSEYESKQVLAAYGVPVVEEALVPEADDVVAAAERLGYPVAVKACGPALMHKSDAGLVALNLNDAGAVRIAVARIIGQAAAQAALDGFLVQRMVSSKREVIVGATRDALFGPCVMLGLGGVFVEAVADVAFRLAPLDERDALEMLQELRGSRIFEAVRGEPAVDRQALSRVIIGAGRILEENPSISQVDINPLLFEKAQPVAVDGLITLGMAEP